MIIEIVSIGDELLSGFIGNSNASYIGKEISDIGLSIKYITTVGDDKSDIIDALKRAEKRSAVIICTGGLGPTHDDITIKSAAEFFNKQLLLDNAVLDKIEERFKSTGKRMNSENRKQALIPDGTTVIDNEIGTAPGIFYRKKGTFFYFFPGVPAEMQSMLNKNVIPFLEKSGTLLENIIIRTAGITESELSGRICDFSAKFPLIKLAFLPQVSGVQMKLVYTHEGVEECVDCLQRAQKFIEQKVGNFIYGYGNDTIEKAAAELLFKKKLSIAVAESCTGGLVSHKLTNISGSSEYYKRGFVTYSNRSKIELLNVSEKIIQEYGAVSAETAIEMAKGVRRVSGTDIGLSVTGIAGPGGGTSLKQVGLVYIAFSDSKSEIFEKHNLFRDRLWNKERSAVLLLDLLRRVLLNK